MGYTEAILTSKHARTTLALTRSVVTLLHRYAGLAAAAFVISAGLTGTILVWNDSLERFFAPQLFVVPPHPARSLTLDPFLLRDEVARRFPGATIDDVPLGLRPDQSVVFGLDAEWGSDATRRIVHDDQVFLDPITGEVLGTRRSGDLRQGVKNVMPFVYSIHDSLVLGDAGELILGIAALLWALQCFSGGYLTFPLKRAISARAGNVTPGKSWFARWQSSWKIRTYGDFKKIAFDIHRAGGLWLWVLLFIYASSAMSFNLPSIYNPIVGGLLGSSRLYDSIPNVVDRARPASLDFRQAYAAAVSAVARVADEQHFRVLSERLMMYHAEKHLYEYRVQSTRDIEARGNTQVYIDADSGVLLGIDFPTGGALGTSVTAWIEALHEAMVFGLPYKIAVSLFGLFVATLSITGVIVWLKKKRPGELKRLFRFNRQAAR